MSFIDKAKEAFEDAWEAVSETIEKAKDSVGETVDKVQDAAEPVEIETLHMESDPGTLPSPGVLGDMGYRVGKSGLSGYQRREILNRVFRVQLVATSPWTQEYVREWGERCTEARWNKMRQALYGLNAVARRRTNADMSEAIDDRQQDLEWLTEDYDEWLTGSHRL